MTTTLNLPGRTAPYLDHYLGLWMMQPESFWAKYELIERMDISLHMEQAAQQAAEPPEEEPKPAPRPTGGYGYALTEEGIAILSAQGTLMKQESSLDQSTSTIKLRRDLRTAAADPAVKGIMLHISSPGGTVAGAYELADDAYAAAQAKPVHAFIEDLGASAAYLLASQTASISANRTAEVGSIGTRMFLVDSSVSAEKRGLRVIPIDSGGMKSAGLPGTPITEEQQAYFQRRVDEANQHFLEAVSRGRGISLAAARTLGDGRMHAARTAMELGLIDQVETFDQALARLAQQINQQQNDNDNDAASAAESTARSAGVSAETDAGLSQETAMSKSTEPAAAAVANVTPKPATIAELKAAFPDDPTFIVECAEKGLSLIDAKAAQSEVLAQRIQKQAEDHQGQITALKAEHQKALASLTSGHEAALAAKDAKIAELEQKLQAMPRGNAPAAFQAESDPAKHKPAVAAKPAERTYQDGGKIGDGKGLDRMAAGLKLPTSVEPPKKLEGAACE